MGETWGVEEVVVGNRLWNRPALCCTWSRGSCERPRRVSSLDASVSKYRYFPWSFLSLCFKSKGLSCFPSCARPPQRESVLLFLCPDSITSAGPLFLTSAGLQRYEKLLVYGMWYVWFMEIPRTPHSKATLHLQPFFPCSEVLLNSSLFPPEPRCSLDPLHSPPRSLLLLFTPNL